MKDICLRKYQIECIEKIQQHLKSNNSCIVTLPTGAGKTIVFTALSKQTFNRVLVISHRDELVFQTIEKAKYFYKDKDIGIAKADLWDVDGKKIISASIQTLYNRLNQLKFTKNLDAIIIDETHHFAKNTYLEVYNSIKKLNPNVKLIGFTATPFRSDKQSLIPYFGQLVYNKDIRFMLKHNYLVNPLFVRIGLGKKTEDYFKDIRKFKVNEDYYKLNSTIDLNKIFVNTLLDRCKERQCIVFCESVEHSILINRLLNEIGVKSEHIDGTTDKFLRKQIITNYKKNQIQYLTNYAVLTEGVDLPNTSCIAIIRKSDNLLLYTQMIGRGLRLSYETDKVDCKILEFYQTPRNRLGNFGKLFKINKLIKEMNITSKDLEEFEEIKLDVNDELSNDYEDIILKFKKEDEVGFIDDEKVTFYKLIFRMLNSNIMLCNFENKFIIMEESKINLYNVAVIQKEGYNYNLLKLIDDLDKDIAYSTMLDLYHQEQTHDLSKLKSMIYKEITNKQIELIRKFPFRNFLNKKIQLNSLNRYDASALISYLFYMNYRLKKL